MGSRMNRTEQGLAASPLALPGAAVWHIGQCFRGRYRDVKLREYRGRQ